MYIYTLIDMTTSLVLFKCPSRVGRPVIYTAQMLWFIVRMYEYMYVLKQSIWIKLESWKA